MYKKLFLFLFTLTFFTIAFAQQADPVLFTINGKPVYRSEVQRAYDKGNEYAETKETISDFVRSYADFRRNVEEAKAQRLDTVRTYINSYRAYKDQISEPYLKDTVSEPRYIKKIYDRMLENVEINHIMFPFSSDVVFPADTLEVYEKAVAMRKKILKDGFKGEEFRQELTSSMLTKLEDRKGYIGWTAPFMFPYKVEDAIYSLPVGEVSLPIRSAKGYHIIQVLGKRPAAGSVEIEQVIFGFPKIPPTQHQIDSVSKVANREYKNIRSSADFQSLCDEFSAVHETGDNGCYFGVIGLESNLPPAFTMAAFSLENPGDVSPPVMTNYGFHIQRLLRKIPVPELSVINDQLREKIIKSDKVQEYSNDSRRQLISQFNVRVDENAYNKLKAIATTISPRDSLFLENLQNGEDIIFSIDNERNYQVKEFVKYLGNRQRELQRDPNEIQMFQVFDASPYSLSTDLLKDYFDSFVSMLVSNYAEYTLEKRNPEFGRLMGEFSDGLLLFDVMDKNVWKKSKTDEIGLAKCFEKNKSKYSLGGKKYKGIIVYAKNEEYMKEARSVAKKQPSVKGFIETMRATLNKDSVVVRIEPGLWAYRNNAYVDNQIFGEPEPAPLSGYPYFFVTGKFITKPEDFTDVRTAVENDYQAQLEEEWSAYLKNKYKVEIDESVLNTMK
ncbi:peptidyl-prolyl cis-trans isomerase [Dysgonomonas sp. OttesenSCG-928-D17]|nr:peptidyl-prolyl cis-trans isomerase [Dysgonomonas sp. OttesenSCG-928-D17]